MSNFWDLSDGGTAVDTGTEFDAGGGDYEVIPKGTNVLAMVDEVVWKEWEGTEYLNIKWRILKAAAYENRVIFHKLYLTDDDPKAKDPAKKRDKARRMFAAIDANAGGKLLRKAGKPTNEEMAMALTNKQMVLTLGVWDKEDANGKTIPGGNWVMSISDKSKPVTTPDAPVSRGNGGSSMSGRRNTAFDDDLDGDDVPFISMNSVF